MVRSNSGDWKMIFRTKLRTLSIGLMKCGRAKWKEAEATRKDYNIVLTRQEKKFFISNLFKVIQDAIPLILHYRTMCLFRKISSSTFIILDVRSIYPPSGLIPGGQNSSRDRQTVFFTAVNPTHKNHQDPMELDLTKPRLASYKQKWKVHQDTVYRVAQRKGLKFYQTRLNAIILHDTLSAFCILKVVVMESGEIIYEKVHASPLPPPKISFKDNWMKELDSEVAGSSKDTQRIRPKPKTQLSRTVRPVGEQPAGSFTQEIGKDVMCGREGTKNSRTGRHVDGPSSIQSCVPVSVELVDIDEDADENVDADQTRTVKPVSGQSFSQLEERDIDFRVQDCHMQLWKKQKTSEFAKIENYPHREALQADLQQNNVYNPFSNNSKAMIREMGNVELFELCATIPKVQISQCLLYWNQGVIYCTCGHFLVESESRRKFHKLRLDALSIPNYVIKKGRNHGAQHGKTEEQKEYQKAFNAWKRCRKRVDSQDEHYKGIHDLFLRDQVHRESQLKIGWTEKKCIEMNELAQQDHTYRLSKSHIE